MENIFGSLRVYAGKWNLVSSRAFNEVEKATIARAEVVPSQYGPACCFFMKSGGQTYIPVSTNSSLAVGDTVNMETAKLVTLERDGEVVTRVE